MSEISNLEAHVYCMIIALSAFTTSFILSFLFLLQERLIKRRKISRLVALLPPLEWMSRLNFVCLTVGTIFLATGVFGGLTALRTTADPWAVVLHPTVLLTGIMLVLYSLPVVLRKGALERARNVSAAGVVFYPLFIFVFLGAHGGV